MQVTSVSKICIHSLEGRLLLEASYLYFTHFFHKYIMILSSYQHFLKSS